MEFYKQQATENPYDSFFQQRELLAWQFCRAHRPQPLWAKVLLFFGINWRAE